MTGATGVPPEPEEHSPRWPSPTTNDQALTLELLVHGMGEVPPETSLQDPHVFLYSGGERAGTYRRWGDQDAEDHPEIYTGGCVSEAYASVSNSSYRRQRALGLVALPFLLVNLSHWMVSPSVRNRWAYEILVRLAALCLTMLLALTACEIALDLVAWQCAGDGSCSAAHSWLVFPFGEDVGRWGQPGRRLAVAALAPTVALVLLAAPSLRVSDWYLRPATPHGHAEVGASALEQRDFWCRWQTSSRRLGRAHLAMGLAVVGWAVLEPMLRYDRSHSESLAVLDWALLVMLSVTALWAVAEVVGTDAGRESTGGRPGFPLGRELPKAALAVLATTLAVATMSRPGWHTNGGLPGFTSDFAVVGALAGLVLVLLFALPQGLEKPTPGTPDSGFSGPSTLVLPSLTGPATAALAVGLGVQLSAGVCVATARWLASGDGLPKPPSLLAWLCAAVVVTLLAAMVPACLRLIQRLRRRGVLIAAVRNSYGVLEGKKVGPNTLRLVLALEAARETEFTPTVLGVLAVLTTATSVAAEGAGLDTHTTPSGAAASQGDGLLADVAQATTATGSWLTVGFVLVLIGLGLEAGRSLGLQRMAALILDVSAFWPRAAAPFAPPCYAETAVTDLEWRTRAWLETDPRRAMVFSAHGSIRPTGPGWPCSPTEAHCDGSTPASSRPTSDPTTWPGSIGTPPGGATCTASPTRSVAPSVSLPVGTNPHRTCWTYWTRHSSTATSSNPPRPQRRPRTRSPSHSSRVSRQARTIRWRRPSTGPAAWC
jgi:hypothetical protein